ncbi:MAG TPA: DNA cytosine methyltransferase [Longimicrobium sp.]|nr:DNA cytosine methyltransferase [Longimicrobium sp.]
MAQRRPTVVDVFCGAGGLSEGFRRAGCRIVYGLDIDPHAMQTFRFNHLNEVAEDVAAHMGRAVPERQAVAAHIVAVLGDALANNTFERWLADRIDDQLGSRLDGLADLEQRAVRRAAKLLVTRFPTTDVCRISAKEILKATGVRKIDIVVGGPNCQGVSERGLRDPDNPKNQMLREYFRLVDELRPRFFVMENVPGLAHAHNLRLLKEIYGAFKDMGYAVAGDVLRAADYGVPQLRYRFFLIGSRDAGINPLFPAPTHGDPDELGSPAKLNPHVTVREAIGDLPVIGAGEGTEEAHYVTPTSFLGEYARRLLDDNKTLYNHRSAATSDVNLRRIEHVPEGGNWKDIPGFLLPRRFFQVRLTDHSTTYARVRWDYPSYTITALFGNVTAGAFTHPSQHRALSVREGARLHGYFDSYRFLGPLSKQYRQIGNSVPPILAEAIARAVMALTSRKAGKPRRGYPVLVKARLPWDLVHGAESIESLPVLAPRFKPLFGGGTKRPVGWPADVPIDKNYKLLDRDAALCGAFDGE